METSALHLAVKKIAGDIPAACSFIYDGEEKRFIYSSNYNIELESVVVHLDNEKGLASLIDLSASNFLQIPSGLDGHILFIKRMATNLYFGMCVMPDTDVMQAAAKVMTSTIQVQPD